MGKLLVKYDIRGIQAFVFRTNKLKEIRAVSDLPEKIISAASEKVLKQLKINSGIEFIDKAGGNALAVIDSQELFEAFSTSMAAEILRMTYSLKLVYAAVECTDNFYKDYDNLNKKLGKLKSEMPEACHTGAFPICRQDYLTGFPVAFVKDDEYNKGKKKFLTAESVLKLRYVNYDKTIDTHIDSYIKEKGEDSHVAVIHIDGNNMGNRINEIISKAEYDEGFAKIKAAFDSVHVSRSFGEVCDDIKQTVEAYKTKYNINKPLIFSVIRAGDDITYITQADIALSFTKLFLKKISEKDMYKGTDDNTTVDHQYYGINACAGIAFVKSHFPFSDAYELAEKCCAEAKKRAKEFGDGNWIDFEICTHIKDVDLSSRRKKYGITTDTEGNKAFLHMRPYCVAAEGKSNEFFDYDKFEERIKELRKETLDDTDAYNRSRSKALRQAYVDGGAAVSNFKSLAESRNYKPKEYFEMYSEKNFAVYYDAIDIMDMMDEAFSVYVNGVL